MQQILSDLAKFKDLDVEVCGTWVWVGGETKAHKEELKALGMRFSGKKSKWYWSAGLGKGRKRGKYTMPKIREKFGSVAITDEVMAEVNSVN